jgi:hypothetical protein
LDPKGVGLLADFFGVKFNLTEGSRLDLDFLDIDLCLIRFLLRTELLLIKDSSFGSKKLPSSLLPLELFLVIELFLRISDPDRLKFRILFKGLLVFDFSVSYKLSLFLFVIRMADDISGFGIWNLVIGVS